MAERGDLVLGAMQRVDRKDRVAISPRARLIEIVAPDLPGDILPFEQKWLEVGANEPVGDMAGNQGAAAAHASAELDHIAAEQIPLDHKIGNHASKAAHRPIGHGALPKTRIAGKDLL